MKLSHLKFIKRFYEFKFTPLTNNIILDKLEERILSKEIKYIDAHSHILNAYCAVESTTDSVIDLIKDKLTSAHPNQSSSEDGENIRGSTSPTSIKSIYDIVESLRYNSMRENLEEIQTELNFDSNYPFSVVALPIDFTEGGFYSVNANPKINFYEQQMITFALAGCETDKWIDVYDKLRANGSISSDTEMFLHHGLEWESWWEEHGWTWKSIANDKSRLRKKLTNLVKNNRGKVLPAIGLDPRRLDDAKYNEFITKDCIELGGVAWKMYPAQGWSPFDYKDVFIECNLKKFPIYVHATDGGVWANHPQNNLNGHPENFQKIINEYQMSDLRLNLCHFGSTELLSEPPGDWNRIVKELIEDNNNQVYSDLAYTACYDNCNDKVKTWMDGNEEIKKGLMFGTDYWMVEIKRDVEEYVKKAKKTFGDLFNDLALRNPFRFLTGRDLPDNI